MFNFKLKKRKISLRVKLHFLTLLVLTVFLLNFSLTFFVSSNVQSKFLEVAVGNNQKLLSNSQLSRDLSILFSEMDILAKTFYNQNDYLQTEGDYVLEKLKDAAAIRQKSELSSSLTKLEGTFKVFLEAAKAVNANLDRMRDKTKTLHDHLTGLENVISDHLLQFTLAEKDTSFMEQQLSLAIGYRESVLNIEKLLAVNSYGYRFKQLPDNSGLVVKAISNLLLRLKTINASIPEIVFQGQLVSTELENLLDLVRDFHPLLSSLEDAESNLRQAEKMSVDSLFHFEQGVIETTNSIQEDVEKIIEQTYYSLFSLSIASIFVLLGAISYFLRNSINRPLETILSTIGMLKKGRLDTRASLSRTDEWAVIGDGLNEMAENLSLSYRKIEDSEKKFRDLVSLLPQIIYEADVNGRITFFNRAGLLITGYSAEEVSDNLNIFDLIYPEDLQKAKDVVSMILKGGKAVVGNEYRLVKKDGSFMAVLSYSGPIAQDGRIVGIRGSVVDISEHKKAEQAVRESRHFLDSVIEHIPNMIFIKDAQELKFIRLNNAAEQLLGYPKDSFIGKSDYDFFPAEQASFFVAKDREVLRRRVVLDIPEESIQTKTKGTRILHTKKIPILDLQGNSKYLLGVSEDITEKIEAEKQLKEYAENKAILLREVNHRTTNNLTSILSMFNAALRSEEGLERTSDATILKDLARRVEGLLTVHRLLTASEWMPLSLKTVCEKIIDNSLQGHVSMNYALNISGDEVLVDSEQASHIALVINELSTNTVKHGLPICSNIRIRLKISREGEKIFLSYKDNGCGYPAEFLAGESLEHSLGMGLIRGIVEYSLQGKLHVTNDKGAQTFISFPESKVTPAEREKV